MDSRETICSLIRHHFSLLESENSDLMSLSFWYCPLYYKGQTVKRLYVTFAALSELIIQYCFKFLLFRHFGLILPLWLVVFVLIVLYLKSIQSKCINKVTVLHNWLQSLDLIFKLVVVYNCMKVFLHEISIYGWSCYSKYQ